MSKNVDAFDALIPSTFVELNTPLEELYSLRKTARTSPASVTTTAQAASLAMEP